MTEALDKVSGLRHLPLFPLPLVMLPNEVLPLHIFEERYRQMLKDVAADRNMFGVTLFEPAGAYVEKPATGTVGCVAEIKESETFPDGRSNILTVGVVRFRINDYVEDGSPYFVGDVEYFEDDPADPEILGPLADEVFELFERMARAAFKIGGNRGTFPEIQQTDPESLSFLITAAFNFENDKKYRLLEMTSTVQRLNELQQLLRRTVDQMEENASLQVVSKQNGHSKKKLDI
ncbi:MAG TPA: LON peptidase substrate-binding domain-containing protein [Pyrinomonadaceae bacterium]|nr:LON peptidase substrate-binding domain-containing protein [Pyrinomonadaceae bacterium]